MATPEHEVEVEVQSEEAARARHDVGVGLGSGRPLPAQFETTDRSGVEAVSEAIKHFFHVFRR